MGKRELAGLNLDLVIPTGRRGGTARRGDEFVPPPPPPPPPRVQSDKEIQQRNLNIFIESLGDMDKEAKDKKIAYWILNYNANKNNNAEAEDAGKKEVLEELQQPELKDADKNGPEKEPKNDEEDKQEPKNDKEDKQEPKNDEEDEQEPKNEQEPKKDVRVETVLTDDDKSGSAKPQAEEDSTPGSDGSDGSDDTDGSDDSYDGHSVSSTETEHSFEKQKFNAAVSKQKEQEAYWKAQQPAPKYPKLPTNKKVKNEPVKSPAKGNRKRKQSEEEGRKRAPQVKRAPGEAPSQVKQQLDHQVREALFGVVNPMKTTMNMSTPYMMTDEYTPPERWTEEEAAAFRTEKAFPKVKFAVVCYTEQQPNANGGGGNSGGVLGFNRFHIWTGSAKNSDIWAPVLKPLEATCHPMLHQTYDEFHSSVFGAPPIKRARARKVVNLVVSEGHPALAGKRAHAKQDHGDGQKAVI